MPKSPIKGNWLWSKVTVMDRIEVQIARVWAHLSSIAAKPCSRAVQEYQISPPASVRPTTPGRNAGIGRPTRPDCALDLTSGLADAFSTRLSFTGGLVPPPVSFPTEDRPR